MRRSCAAPFLLATTVSVVALGCPRDYPPPNDAIEDPGELLAAMDAAHNEVQTARFKEVRLDYYGEEGRLSVKQLILVAKPDKLRVQTYIPGFDGIAGVLVCACGRFAYHDRRENKYYYGQSYGESVGKVLPIALSCRDVGLMLLGDGPRDRMLLDGASTTNLSWDRMTGRYKLAVSVNEGRNKGEVLTLQVRHGDWQVAAVTTDKKGQRVFEYTAKDWDKTDGRTFPGKRFFVVKESGDDFSLTGGNIEINPELPEVLFGLAPPAGTPVVPVGVGAGPNPPGDDLCTELKPAGAREMTPAPETSPKAPPGDASTEEETPTDSELPEDESAPADEGDAP